MPEPDGSAEVSTRPSSFDRASWIWTNARLMGTAATLAYAASLICEHYWWLRALGVLSVIEVGLIILPWRLPRSGRSGASFWAESLVGTTSVVGSVVVVAISRPAWLDTSGAWYAYPIAIAVASGLIALGGVTPRSVWQGELAFVLGPTLRAHGLARAYAGLVGAVGEEALFRAPGTLGLPSPPLALLGAVGFVGRHYVQPGTNRRGSMRSSLVEVTGAVALLLLTALSGSIYPALVAHLLNNLPQVVTELQREPENPDEY
jgi:hypothetical protein